MNRSSANPVQALAIVAALVLSASTRPAWTEETKPDAKDPDIEQARTTVDAFLIWTDPQLYERADPINPFKDQEPQLGACVEPIKALFAKGGEISVKEAGEKFFVTIAPEEFAKQLERMRFAFLARRELTEKPVYEKKENDIEVRFKSILQPEGQKAQTHSYRLTLRKSGEAWCIAEAHIEELAAKAGNSLPEISTRRKPGEAYNPRSGLGMRYLGGGHFGFTVIAFSPDGTKLAYASLSYASSEICVLDLKTGASARITETPYWECQPSFSKDGKSVLFLSDQEDDGGGLFRAELAGGAGKPPVAVAPEIRAPFGLTVAPDGAHMACFALKDTVPKAYLMNADGSKVLKLETNQPVAAQLRFTSDGSRLLVRSEAEGAGIQSLGWTTIESFDPAAKAPEKGYMVLQAPLQSELLGVLDGREEKLIYKRIQTNGKPGIYERALKREEEGEIVSTYKSWPLGAILTPDGKYLLFVDAQDRDFEYDLYACALTKDAQPVRLTKESGYISGVAAAQDGKCAAFLWEPKGAPGRGKGTLMLVDLETKELRTLGKNH